MREAPAQMPGFLGALDDPWGITWRVANRLRRLSLRRSLRFLAGWAAGVRHVRPVFVLGVPRSGTTLVFRWLRASRELGALPWEGHDLWRAYHHPRRSAWRSDAVGAGEIGRGERRWVEAYLHSHFPERRFVEKTPENCLRVPYLLELFPDARFVVVWRSPADVVHSLLQGWRDPEGRYRSYFVPEDLHIPGYGARRRWCFALIEGWRQYVSAPLVEIAFEQWRQCAQALIEARRLVPRERWLEIHLEDLLARPAEMAPRVYAAAEITPSPVLDETLAELIREPVNALSPPGAEKWRGAREEIEPLLPRFASLAAEVGYRIDATRADSPVTRGGP